MTIKARFATGLAAVSLTLGLAFAPAAFAQDKMSNGDGMKKETMSKDGMKKHDAMSKDKMSKDTMKKDSMKKGDAMSK